MSPNELYALGYALEYSCWGVRIFREDAAHMTSVPFETKTIHFPDGPVKEAVAVERGWEYAAADYVQRRLEA